MSTKKVFISYSRVNRDFAEKLVDSLREAGLDVWFDKNIRTGTEWDEVLEQEIEEADNLIIALSKTSVESDNVKNEMFYAQQHDTTVNLIMIEPCDLPLAMARMHYIDFGLDYDKGVKRLVEDITYTENATIQKTETQVVSKSHTKGVEKAKKPSGVLKYIVGGVLAILLVVVFIVMSSPDNENPKVIEQTTTKLGTGNTSGWRKVTSSTSVEEYMAYIETYGDDEGHFNDAFDSIQDLMVEEGAVLIEVGREEPLFIKYLYVGADGNYTLNDIDNLNMEDPESGDILVAMEQFAVMDSETMDVKGGVFIYPGDYMEYFGVVDENDKVKMIKFYYQGEILEE